VHAEALTVIVVDFVLSVGIWRSFHITIFGTYHGASVIMHRVFNWKHSSICMLDVDAVPHSCIP
jgi:hypothetical protein